MKNAKYLLLTLIAACAVIGCEKHSLSYAPSDLVGDKAMFQICYVEPLTVNTANGIDSVFVNNVMVAGANGAGQLAVKGTYPYGPSGTTGTFFTTNAGVNNIKFYRKGNLVYDKDITLNKGHQKVFVYKLDADPVILDNLYPYSKNPNQPTVGTFDTDSVATIRFYNFVFKGNANTPYPGKVKYQWRDNTGKKDPETNDYYWHDLGDYVGFGEATERVPVIINKSVYNSSGYNTLRFHCIDENGKEVAGSTDYWTTYIGRVVDHVFWGVLGGSPKAAYIQSCSLGASY